MNILKRKWKLGWAVLLRAIHFYFFLGLFGLVLVPVRLFVEWAEKAPTVIQVVGGLACLAYGLIFLPLVFFWTASSTGHLQGSDQDEIRKLAR